MVTPLKTKLKRSRMIETIYLVLFIFLGTLAGWMAMDDWIYSGLNGWSYVFAFICGFSGIIAAESLSDVKKANRLLGDPLFYAAAIQHDLWGGFSQEAATDGTAAAQEAEGLGLEIRQEPWSRLPKGETEESPRPTGEEKGPERTPVLEREAYPRVDA